MFIMLPLFFKIVLYFAIASGYSSIPDSHKEIENNYSDILSRKRRYLLFPEGSSFQVVYDDIIGVVDYTNYLILGVTVALAWELPSKPPSEILDDLRERLKDGTFGISRNDTINKIKYTNKDHKTKNYEIPSTHSKKNFPQSMYLPTIKEFNKGLGYLWNVQHNSNTGLKSFAQPFIKNHRIQRKRFNQHSTNILDDYQSYRKHRIYSILGKRSIQSNDKTAFKQNERKFEGNQFETRNLNNIHIRYHRSTRYDFYQKIEKYLDKRGMNGFQCILRALCETGQKSNSSKPKTFVAEILRVTFTLPERLHNESIHYKNKLFDEAHNWRQNCKEKYRLCKYSMWEAEFIK